MDPDALSLDELLVDLNKWDRVNELIIEHEEFDVIPANGSYSGTRTPLDSATNSEKRLTKVLAELDSEYHYIILDCPPSLDSFAKNGLY